MSNVTTLDIMIDSLAMGLMLNGTTLSPWSLVKVRRSMSKRILFVCLGTNYYMFQTVLRISTPVEFDNIFAKYPSVLEQYIQVC